MTAPESVDRRADIYALGVILYEMLTARRPFTPSKDTAELQRQIVEMRPAPLQRPEIPRALEELVVHKMLAKDPANRPSTMTAVAAAPNGLMTREAGSAMPRRRGTPLPTVKPEEIQRDPAPAIPRALLDTPFPAIQTAPVAKQPAKKPYALYTVAGLS